MQVLRKLFIGLLAFILLTAAVGTAWAATTTQTLRDRDTVKGWLEESGLYDNFAEGFIETVRSNAEQNAEQEQAAGELPLNDTALTGRIKDVLTPDLLRSNVNQVLDGMYNWLEGEAETPDFRLDLTETRDKLAAAVGAYATERAASLPMCTTVPETFDVFDAECLPPGTDPAAIGQQAKDELLASESFLGNPVITADTLKVQEGETEKPLFAAENSAGVQRSYALGAYAAIASVVVMVVAAAGIILLSSRKISGIRRAGATLLSASILLAIPYGMLHFGPRFFDRYIADNIENATPVLDGVVSRLAHAIAADIRGFIGLFALIYLLAGLAAVVITSVLLKKRALPTEVTPHDPVPPVDDSPKQPDPSSKPVKPMSRTQAPKPPRKIQL